MTSPLWCDACAEGRHGDCVGTIECTCYAYGEAHGGHVPSNVGRENWYACDACGAVTVTVDVDDGTTPMLTPCPKCGGEAQSGWYMPKPLGVGPPTWEWYRPATGDLVGMSKETKLHVSLGGLLMRPRTRGGRQ